MSQRKDLRLERVKLEVLKPHAHKFDLDHEADYARPGNSPPERAFQVLSCGLDLLIAVADSAVPSLEKRARRTAGRWTREYLIYSGANSSGFLARSISTLLSLTGGRLDNDDHDPIEAVTDPEHHLLLRRSFEDFYPKLKRGPRQTKDPIENCRAEFDVMTTRQPREAVASGDEPAGPYSMALLRGEDPSQDPELVEMQQLYARDFFIQRASLAAIRMSVEAGDRRRLSGRMIQFLDPHDRKQRKYRAEALAAWNEGSRAYREYALMELERSPAAAPVVQPQ